MRVSVLLGEILRLATQRDPGKTAIIAGDVEFTYTEYNAAANRFANLLLDAGIKIGDRIASVLFNTPEYGIVHFGNARAGSILVHISPMYAAPAIAGIVKKTRPRLLIVDAAIAEKIDQISDQIPWVERIIILGDAFQREVGSHPVNYPALQLDPSAPVAMTFTGGTTGEPKGAVVSHTARYVSAWTTALEHHVTGRDIAGVVTPMFHAVSLMIWYQSTILAGCTSVIFRRWDPGEFLEQTERHGISTVFMVPVQVRDLLESDGFSPDRLATLKNIGVGGAMTPAGLIDHCRAALPHCGYTDHYGQSETGPLTILKPWDAESHKGTIGRPATGVDIRIVDEEGTMVPPGEIGELICRGPFLMDGYFESDAETREYFRNDDGWGWSGDLATMDEDGFIKLVGRSKEMIVSGGINIYPREIEVVLEAHPSVDECTVFGVPDERWGESLVAYVVLLGNTIATEDELSRYCSDQLARYKRPRQVVFVPNIPKTPSGKIQKPLLREAFLAGGILP
ncbi:MAG: AMP-binding protein [Pseudomonadota bacterium]|nr:AMP-binding protein [Pseudomonadota bacterium]